MKAFLKKYKYLLMPSIVVAVGLLLDILSKAYINANYELYAPDKTIIPYLINFTHVHNNGAAFGFGAGTKVALYFFILVSSISSIALTIGLILYGHQSKLLSAALALILAGALGNLIDRVMLGYVDDFIVFAFWKDFAIFNIADCCISIGAVLYAIYFLFIFKFVDKQELKESGE